MNIIHDYTYIFISCQSNCIILNMKVKEEVKIMLGSKCMTITELAKKMTELSGRNYSQSLISHKLSSESLKYTEMKMICKILGYRIYIDIDEIRLGR